MNLSGRVIAELLGGLIAIACAFAVYFLGVSDRFWIGACIGIGCILLGAAAFTLSQQQER
jgi:hypothetical protein